MEGTLGHHRSDFFPKERCGKPPSRESVILSDMASSVLHHFILGQRHADPGA